MAEWENPKIFNSRYGPDIETNLSNNRAAPALDSQLAALVL
jgi:hypothetical protein